MGFYGGDDFRVTLNGSVYMFAAELSSNDIDTVTANDTQVTDLQPLMNIGQIGSQIYADGVEGDINNTTILIP